MTHDHPPVYAGLAPVPPPDGQEHDELHDTRLPDGGPLPDGVDGYTPHAPHRESAAWYPPEAASSTAFGTIPRRHAELASVCADLSRNGVWCRREGGHDGECLGWQSGAPGYVSWHRTGHLPPSVARLHLGGGQRP
jgi:hypothetical protein